MTKKKLDAEIAFGNDKKSRALACGNDKKNTTLAYGNDKKCDNKKLNK